MCPEIIWHQMNLIFDKQAPYLKVTAEIVWFEGT